MFHEYDKTTVRILFCPRLGMGLMDDQRHIESLLVQYPGVDPFGMPYLIITRYSDKVRLKLWKQFRRKGGVLSGRWSFGADPNTKSFYDLYLPATGCVIHVGKGWAQRMFDRYGQANDAYNSFIKSLVS